jgi:hypothetical protein
VPNVFLALYWSVIVEEKEVSSAARSFAPHGEISIIIAEEIVNVIQGREKERSVLSRLIEELSPL